MTTQYLDPSNFGTLDLATANKLYTRGQDSSGRGGMNYLTAIDQGGIGNWLDFVGYSGDRNWIDPNATYYSGGLNSAPGLDPDKYHKSNIIYKVDSNGQLVPVSAYGIESKGGGFGADLVGGLAKYGTMAALAWSGGQALGAIASGLAPAADTATTAATTAGQIGGQGLTSAQAAALYGDVGYGAGMTGAETAAFDAAIGGTGLTGSDILNYGRKGYDIYNKGKNILGLLSGGGEQPAPQSPQGTGMSGFTPVSHSLNLGNPRLGAAQAQEKAFTEQSYAPVAQEEQRRRLKGLLSQNYV